jgi:hypothetical protein
MSAKAGPRQDKSAHTHTPVKAPPVPVGNGMVTSCHHCHRAYVISSIWSESA